MNYLTKFYLYRDMVLIVYMFSENILFFFYFIFYGLMREDNKKRRGITTSTIMIIAIDLRQIKICFSKRRRNSLMMTIKKNSCDNCDLKDKEKKTKNLKTFSFFLKLQIISKSFVM